MFKISGITGLWKKVGVSAAIATMTVGSTVASTYAADQWSYWRGTSPAEARGVAEGESYPVSWDFPAGATWERDLSGRGGSTPIVVGDQLLITQGADGKNQLVAFDVATGKQNWVIELGDDTGGKHKKGSGSNPSPTTDGKFVYAYYRSGDLACVDLEGNKVWHRNLQQDYGEDTLWWDLGSSPLLTDDCVVIAAMQSPPSPSYLAGFDKATGETVWKVDRELDAPREAAQSYTSPMLATVGEQEIIAVLGADHLTLHDASNGKELGRLGGLNPEQNAFFRSIASPVVAGEIIVCPYARGDSLTAVDMAALIAGKGEDAIVWQHYDLGADVPTPCYQDGLVYLLRDRGTVVGIDVKSGETIWEVTPERNRTTYSSSPLVAGNQLYTVREDGTVFVLKLNGREEPEVAAQNRLTEDQAGRSGADIVVASPIPVQGGLIFRTAKTLLRIDQ